MLWVFYGSTNATYAAEQADSNPPRYEVSMDGQLMMFDPGDGHLVSFSVSDGGGASVGYFPAGPHHFTIGARGMRPGFDGDGEIAAGGTTSLFVYGPLDARQGRFIDAPNEVPAGMEHVVVINLMRSGQQIEVVSCADASTCATLQEPPLSEGDAFVADLPALGLVGSSSSFGPDGAGYGYRLVPSASVPNPPVLPLQTTWGSLSAASFIGGPAYLSDAGDAQETF